ncbi:hypothetical protein [Microseira wollei]|uniref:hypothetical protein n=1 Tax=Microseira wollei TaxID=467598 RepID=UPI001CFCF7C1|nr:hypothetical protein [Microseira wollei]
MPPGLTGWQLTSHCSRRYNAKRLAGVSWEVLDEALGILSLGTSDTALGGDVSRTGKISVLLEAIPVELGNPIRHGVE